MGLDVRAEAGSSCGWCRTASHREKDHWQVVVVVAVAAEDKGKGEGRGEEGGGKGRGGKTGGEGAWV